MPKLTLNEYLDRYRGLQPEEFGNVLAKIKPSVKVKKTKDNPSWNNVPLTPKEESIYFGVHIHNESNPLGLHTHIIGGKLGGGHSHGPQNRFGDHTHKIDKFLYGTNLDGSHTHDMSNCPAGAHDHIPENFS